MCFCTEWSRELEVRAKDSGKLGVGMGRVWNAFLDGNKLVFVNNTTPPTPFPQKYPSTVAYITEFFCGSHLFCCLATLVIFIFSFYFSSVYLLGTNLSLYLLFIATLFC